MIKVFTNIIDKPSHYILIILNISTFFFLELYNQITSDSNQLAMLGRLGVSKNIFRCRTTTATGSGSQGFAEKALFAPSGGIAEGQRLPFQFTGHQVRVLRLWPEQPLECRGATRRFGGPALHHQRLGSYHRPTSTRPTANGGVAQLRAFLAAG